MKAAFLFFYLAPAAWGFNVMEVALIRMFNNDSVSKVPKSFERPAPRFEYQTGLDLEARDRFIASRDKVTRRASFMQKQSIPASKDWRKESICVGSVKNQGHCGSCYAYAATGALEAAHCIKHGQQVSLSEQMYVDCSWRFQMNKGCGGGLAANCYNYTKVYHCSASSEQYPSGAINETCDPVKAAANPVVQVSHIGVIPRDDEMAVLEAVANVGPVVVSFCVDEYFRQFGNNFHDGTLFVNPVREYCRPNHEVVIVGYTPDYIIIRNSWGPQWGQNGYINMDRKHGTAKTYQIYNLAYYPVVL